MNRSILIKIPKFENVLLFYYFTMPIWRDFIFSHFPGGSHTGSFLILLGLIFIVIIKRVNYLEKYADVFLFYGVIGILFLFKFWGNPDMSDWIHRTYGLQSVITWGGLLAYVVIRLQWNFENMLNCLKKAGIVLGIYYAWKSLEVIRNGYWTYIQFDIERHSSSNMSWSYGVLMAICFISIYLFKDKKKIVIFPIALGVIGILVYGSRGTLIGFLIGIVLLIIFYNSGRMSRRSYFILFLFAGLGIFFLSDTGLTIISTTLKNAGLNSRFIDSLVDFSFSNFEETSNGRWIIWITVAELIKNGPFYGYGVMGERNAVYSVGMKWGYSHNVFLEILSNFGWLIGSIILTFAIISIIRFFKNSKNADEKLLFILFMTIGFELLLSNSIWLHCAPWALMALYKNHFKQSYLDINTDYLEVY